MKEFNILYQKSKCINLTLKKGGFSEGVIWDNEIRRPRTENINPFFAQIGHCSALWRGFGTRKKDSPDELSCVVAGGGLEPPASGL